MKYVIFTNDLVLLNPLIYAWKLYPPIDEHGRIICEDGTITPPYGIGTVIEINYSLPVEELTHDQNRSHT